mgnify:CR=1 FL=1|tara:strand:+ start:5126 stop:5368 length:243 start_codon:yes stop_codon:yes gene_type:complete
MISTTVYKYTYTGVKETWGQGWYDTNAIGVVPLKDPYFYLKDGFTVVGITTNNTTISISTVTDSTEKEWLKSQMSQLDPQ